MILIEQRKTIVKKIIILLFNENRSAKEEIYELVYDELMANPATYPFNCDMMCYYHAEQHGMGTKGSYPAVYYWR